MADAFFAKKKKKKAFKGFNANKIDVASVTQTVHVDAPAISEESKAIDASSSLGQNKDESQWDEEAAAQQTGAQQVIVNEKEILDVKTLSENTQEVSDSIKERLKLEETKAALQKARDGMQQEAQRLKEEQQQQKQDTKPANRFSAAAQNVDGGGKWVPPHMRSGGGVSSRTRPTSSFQKLDTKDETLFPDLNTAEKILEQEKKHESVAYKPPKKTPVGGTWGSAAKKKQPAPKQEAPKAAPKEEPKEEPAPAPAPAPVPKPAAEPPKTMPVKKKKKKKDLSTFKPSS